MTFDIATYLMNKGKSQRLIPSTDATTLKIMYFDSNDDYKKVISLPKHQPYSYLARGDVNLAG